MLEPKKRVHAATPQLTGQRACQGFQSHFGSFVRQALFLACLGHWPSGWSWHFSVMTSVLKGHPSSESLGHSSPWLPASQVSYTPTTIGLSVVSPSQRHAGAVSPFLRSAAVTMCSQPSPRVAARTRARPPRR